MVETNQQLQEMMDALGTNAIPPLLAILQADEGRLTSFNRRLTASLPKGRVKQFVVNQWNKRLQIKLVALNLIPLAGTNAGYAVPHLERLAGNTNGVVNNWLAVQALAHIGSPAVEALRRLEKSSPTLRPIVSGIWGSRLQQGRARQRATAALALAEFDPSSYHPIPTLNLMCDSRYPEEREAAIKALLVLVPFHAAARDAVKRVAAESDDENIRQTARSAIDTFYATNSSKRPR